MSLDEKNGYLKVGQMILISVETLNGSMTYLPAFLEKKTFQKIQKIYFVVPF